MLTRPSQSTLYIDPSEPAHYNDHNMVQFSMAKKFIDENARLIRAPILDIGSGDGKVSAYIAGNIAQPLIGVDISAKRVRYANKHYSHEQLHFFRGNAARLRDCRPVSNVTYNTVFSSNSLHHVPKEFQLSVFYSARKLLRKDGVLLCLIPGSSPALHDAIEKAAQLMRWQLFFVDFDLASVRTYESPEYYRMLVLKAGFFNCEVSVDIQRAEASMNPAAFRDFLRGFLPHIAHLKSKNVSLVIQERFLGDVTQFYYESCGKCINEPVRPEITQIKLVAYASPASFFRTIPIDSKKNMEQSENVLFKSRL